MDSLGYPELQKALLEGADRRRFIYGDLESLLYNNRLTHTHILGDTSLVFSTLTPLQYDLLETRCKADFDKWKEWYIASHLWMVSGVVCEGENTPYFLFHNFVMNIPRPYVEIFYTTILGLNRRVARAGRLLPAYCVEPYSSRGWRSVGGVEVASAYRALWDTWNRDEEEYNAEDRQWSHTRAIVASMTAKGAKHLLQEERKAKTKEETRRIGLVEEAVNLILRGAIEDREPLKIMVGGEEVLVPSIQAAHSIDELHAEMMRHIRGERDLHDIAIIEHRKEILDARAKQQRAATEAARVRASASADGSTNTAPMVGYTAEQLKAMNVDLNPTVRDISGGGEAAHHLIDRYMTFDPLRPAQLGASGQPEEVPSSTTDIGKSLQERVASHSIVVPDK